MPPVMGVLGRLDVLVKKEESIWNNSRGSLLRRSSVLSPPAFLMVITGTAAAAQILIPWRNFPGDFSLESLSRKVVVFSGSSPALL